MANNRPSQLIVALQIARMALEKAPKAEFHAYEYVYNALSRAVSELEEAEHLNLNWKLGLYVSPLLEQPLGEPRPQYFVLSTINNELFRLSEYSSDVKAIEAACAIPEEEWNYDEGDVILVLKSNPADVDTHRCAEVIFHRQPRQYKAGKEIVRGEVMNGDL